MFKSIKTWLATNKKQQEDSECADGYGYAVIHLLYRNLPAEELPKTEIYSPAFDNGVRKAITEITHLKERILRLEKIVNEN